MSLTKRQAEDFANEAAVTCCMVHEGDVLTSASFIEPTLFPELEESGMLDTSNALKIGQLLNGSKVIRTVDSLHIITADDVDRYDELVIE